MGSPVSLIIANIYMEYFKDRAHRTAQNPPRLWKGYTYNTFIIWSHNTNKSSFNISKI